MNITTHDFPVIGATGQRDFNARDIGVVVVSHASAATLETCLARLLAARGATVVVNDVGDDAERVAREIVDVGGEAVACIGSVADPDEVERLVATARGTYGGVDIVVNNAGIARPAPLRSMTLEALHDELAVHTLGTILVTRAAWADLRQSGRGAVVNTTSGVGVHAHSSFISRFAGS